MTIFQDHASKHSTFEPAGAKHLFFFGRMMNKCYLILPLSLQREGARVFTPDTIGIGDAHQREWTQSIHLTETRAGAGLPQQNPCLLQLSLRLLPGTSAST